MNMFKPTKAKTISEYLNALPKSRRGEAHEDLQTMRVSTITQSVTIPAAPAQVYEALMDARTHGEMTGGTAKIDPRVGGSFSTFDGYAEGTTVELIPNKKIVQEWRADEPGWPKNHLSIATFGLTKMKGGTRLAFTQSGVPKDCAENIAAGWKKYYWQPLRNLFLSKNT